MKMAREETAFRDSERERNKKGKQMARQDPIYKNRERECNKKSKRMARENPDYRQTEQQDDTNRRKIVRKNSANRIREQMHDTERKKSSRTKKLSLDDLIKNFHHEVGKGPVHKCCICDQLWYRHSVAIFQRKSLPDCSAVDMCVHDVRQGRGKKLICNTCLSHLRKKKIPPSSTVNGMGFPEIPRHLKDSYQAEWRLVSPRIPLMKVFAAPHGGQKKIRENVVNVPCDTVNIFQVLPHSGNEHPTIQVKIKRDLKYTNHVMSQNVRPYKVREAAEYLVTHGKLFKDQGITFDKTWTENDELSSNNDMNDRSLLQIETNDRESHIDRRAIFSNNPDEPQPGCSNRNDSLNLVVRERQMEFGPMIGIDEPQPGCSHWNDSLNHAVRKEEMEFGVITGEVVESAVKSGDGDGNEIGVIEFEVIIGEGDEIEIELEPRNICMAQESQKMGGPIPERKKQDHMAENDD